jgi:hypothetical protein
MTEDQRACYEMLAEVVGGKHHIYYEVKPWGDGIATSIIQGWATFDFNQLTRAVVLAHDRMVRVEIGASGPCMVRLILHKRHKRALGPMYDRHPAIEDAIRHIRGGY